MKGNWSTVPKENFARAREMRSKQTSAEACLWKVLRNRSLGVAFRRQHPLWPYIADFYCPELRLVIEVDGVTHASAEDMEYDTARDAYMNVRGITVKRFRNEEVLRELEDVWTKLETLIARLKQDLSHA